MTANNSDADTTPGALQAKAPWEPMKLGYMGHVTELVLTGEGKISAMGGDTGEPTKKPIPSG